MLESRSNSLGIKYLLLVPIPRNSWIYRSANNNSNFLQASMACHRFSSNQQHICGRQAPVSWFIWMWSLLSWLPPWCAVSFLCGGSDIGLFCFRVNSFFLHREPYVICYKMVLWSPKFWNINRRSYNATRILYINLPELQLKQKAHQVFYLLRFVPSCDFSYGELLELKAFCYSIHYWILLQCSIS